MFVRDGTHTLRMEFHTNSLPFVCLQALGLLTGGTWVYSRFAERK
jgi:hypothetical protein